MARSITLNQDKAFEIYKDSDYNIKLIYIS